jgi:hypothetical protein
MSQPNFRKTRKNAAIFDISPVTPLPNIAGTCHKGFAFVLIPVGTPFVQAILINGKENT